MSEKNNYGKELFDCIKGWGRFKQLGAQKLLRRNDVEPWSRQLFSFLCGLDEYDSERIRKYSKTLSTSKSNSPNADELFGVCLPILFSVHTSLSEPPEVFVAQKLFDIEYDLEQERYDQVSQQLHDLKEYASLHSLFAEAVKVIRLQIALEQLTSNNPSVLKNHLIEMRKFQEFGNHELFRYVASIAAELE